MIARVGKAARSYLEKILHVSSRVFLEHLEKLQRHPKYRLDQRAAEETVEFISSNMGDVVGFHDNAALLDYALGQVCIDGSILEFGVFEASSISRIARSLSEKTIHGFDSFEGLPEDFSNQLKRGDFSLGGRIPRVPRTVILHQGWFENTIPRFLADSTDDCAFIHIDCDLYTSTRHVLFLLKNKITNGTIILFDEYFNFPGWQHHEFKAFKEFTEAHGLRFEYLGYAFQGVCVRITDAGVYLSTDS